MPPGDVLLVITRPEIPLAPYRGWPGRYSRHMTDQGRGRSPAGRGPRHALGTASGPQPSLGPGSPIPGSRAQQVLESDSGPQQALGPTGPLRSLYPADPASATGAMGVTGPTGPTGPLPKTPVRGFPPGRRQDPWADGDTVTSPVPSLSEPQTPFVEVDDDLYVLGDGYPPEDVLFPPGGGYLEGPTPDDLRPASSSRAGRRGLRKERAGAPGWRWSRSASWFSAARRSPARKPRRTAANAPASPSLRLRTTSAASPTSIRRSAGLNIGTRAEDPEPLTIDGPDPGRLEFDGVRSPGRRRT